LIYRQNSFLVAVFVIIVIYGAALAGPASPDPAAVDEVIRWNNLGIAHLGRFREAEAIEAFQKALALDGDYGVGWINLGIAYLAASDYEPAEKHLQRGLELEPGEPFALYNLGLVYKVQGRNEEAMTSFQGVLGVDPDDPDTLYQVASLHARARQWDEAIGGFRRAIALAPHNVSAYYGLGKALVQSGDHEEGRRLLQLSQDMKAQSEMSTTAGLRYGEQGKYSYALEDDRIRQLAQVPAAPAQALRYVAVPADESGLRFRHAGGGDGDLDLYLVNCDPAGKQPDALYRNEGGMKFRDITEAAGLAGNLGPGRAAVFGDYDNDGLADFYRTGPQGGRLFRNQGDGTFQEAGEAAGLPALVPSAGAAWADIDHDGDLDLYVVRDAQPATGNLVFRNDGSGRFEEVSGPTKLAGAGGGFSLVFTDLDNDRDIDLILPRLKGRWQIFSNDRVGTFTDVAERALSHPFAAHAATVGDVNKDSGMDVAATGPDGLRLYVNRSGARLDPVEEVAEAAGLSGPAYGVAFLDFDNDGYLDLAAVPGGAEDPALVLLRNSGEGKWTNWTDKAGLDKAPKGRGRGIGVGDLDGDDDLDLVISRAGGAPLLLRNDGGSERNALQIEPRGKNSNRSAAGIKVEVKAGRMWQKMETASSSGYLSSGPTRVHFGLGKQTRADTLRFLWPGGVMQDELDVALGELVSLEELDRKGSSCPILYSWDGERFAFVTDFLGGSAVGYRLGSHRFNTPDTDEYVKIRGDQLAEKNGRLELRMVNQLEEVIFFDGVRLLAVDHPEETRIYPNERLLPAPPFPEFRIFSSAREIDPVSAVDHQGRDVLASVLAVDRTWPDGFRKLRFKGYAEEHSLILDPGPLPMDRQVVLLADAWIDYADSTSNLAASHAGAQLLPPRLEVVGEDGQWVTAIEQMGFPAGLPKTLTVDLTDVFRREDDRRVRIVTSMRIYWDRVRFAVLEEEPRMEVTTLPASSARLSFHGYPRPVSADGKVPFGYDYADAAQTAEWKDFQGAFTRYGAVDELLSDVDDRYVIARHGDQVAVAFDATALPPLQDGWVRDYLLFADGFGKDMDLNSGGPDRVEPLPFHAMSSYPPPAEESTLTDAERLDWIRRWNTRHVRRPMEPLR
jgi:Flp pilus assembly protein TadD